MATLHEGIQFTGSIGNLSAYRSSFTDKIIVRRKGGASREKIRTHPAFANTRKNNNEFSGRVKMAGLIAAAMRPLTTVADYNFRSTLNALMLHVQRADTTSEKGKRNIRLSDTPAILSGFSLTRKILLESVLTSPINFAIDETRQGQIEIPALTAGVNFAPPYRYPLYRFQATLGLIPDVLFSVNGYRETSGVFSLVEVVSDWFEAERGSPSVVLNLLLNTIDEENPMTAVLGLAIRFGRSIPDGIETVKGAGAGKILMATSSRPKLE